MAEAVERTAGAARAERPARRAQAYGGRFLVAYAVLGLLACAAVAASVVLFTGADDVEEQAWSAWQPEGEESTYAHQIASFVGHRYRLPSRDQLVGVHADRPVVEGPGDFPDIPLSYAQVVNSNSGGSDDIETFRLGDGSLYRLCGLGEGCAIGEGVPSEERGRLLRREGLELALYTFKYVDDADSVIVLLPPPGQPQATSGALFFRRGDLEPLLERPLSQTLANGDRPGPVIQVGFGETALVDRLTLPHLFKYDYAPTPDGTAAIVRLTRDEG